MENREVKITFINPTLVKLYDSLGGIWSVLRRNRKEVYFTGNYRSFKEAEDNCIGYDSEEIFNKVKESTLAARDNKDCYERDGVVFLKKV